VCVGGVDWTVSESKPLLSSAVVQAVDNDDDDDDVIDPQGNPRSTSTIHNIPRLRIK
jgi:hypothetical protein